MRYCDNCDCEIDGYGHEVRDCITHNRICLCDACEDKYYGEHYKELGEEMVEGWG